MEKWRVKESESFELAIVHTKHQQPSALCSWALQMPTKDHSIPHLPRFKATIHTKEVLFPNSEQRLP